MACIVYRCSCLIIVIWNLSMSATSAQPALRGDVMGSYKLSNRKQCHRMCWYRKLCTSYSYFTGAGSGGAHNCILHTTHAETRKVNPSGSSAGWSEKQASVSGIRNGCKNRPCDQRSVCAPRFSPTSSYWCLPVPSQCGTPENVTNGVVILLSGTQQDDVAKVQCYDAHVATPRSVSVKMTCQVTSTWTVFQGTCSQYEFKFDGAGKRRLTLLGPMTEYPTICVTATDFQEGQYHLNLLPESRPSGDVPLHAAIRYEFDAYEAPKVIWTKREHGCYGIERYLGPQLLAPGDSFNLTLHVQGDRLVCTLNETHVFDVPLLGVNGSADGVNLSQFAVLELSGSATTSYVNLLNGC